MRARRFVSGIAALVLTLVALFAPPWFLLATVGNPWPGRNAVDLHDQAAVVSGVLALIAWLLWARFALALVVETVRQSGERGEQLATILQPGAPVIVAPGRAGGGGSRLAGALVAAILALLPTAGAARPAVGAPSLPPRQALPAAVALRAGEPTAATAHAGAPTIVVAAGDTLYSLARRHLGDASRWREIFELNRDRAQPDGERLSSPSLIRPGWQLALPSSGAVADPAVSGGRTHVVGAGDSYWAIAGGDLAASADGAPTPADVLAYTQRLIAANAPRLGHHDPALLVPGESVDLETAAVVTLPPPPPVPAPDPGPLPPLSTPAPIAPDPSVPPPTSTTPAPPTSTMPASPTTPTPPTSTTTTSTTSTTVTAVAGASVSAPSGWRRGLGAGVLLSAGVGGLLLARRRSVMRGARSGARLRAPTEREARTERALGAATGALAAARLDVALRAAAGDLAAQQARLLAVTMAEDGTLRLVTDRSCMPSSGPWRVDIETGSWILPAAVDLAELAAAARQTPIPSPALVALGRTHVGELHLDLEAIGLLCIDAGRDGAAIARHVAATIAVSPFADGIRLVTVGLDETAALHESAAEVAADLPAALERAVGWASSTTGALAPDGSTFALRVHSDGETWDPAVLVASVPEIDADLADAIVGHCAGGGRGLAVVLDRPIAGVPWVLRRSADALVLEPLGIEIEVIGLEVDDVEAVAELIAAAGEPAVDQPIPLPLPLSRDAADEAFVEPEWSLLVLTLGHVAVESPDGATVAFERSKALELVVWLSMHRDRPTRSGARTALWDLDVRDTTFANVVSDARRAMARAVAPPTAEEWIGRNVTEQLPLHRLVIADADLLGARSEFARGRRAHDIIDILRPGLELVSGMPFADTAYQWIDSGGLASSLTLLVTSAAADLAGAFLAIGDVEGVFWATGQGLKVLAGHEELIALRMRAHAEQGDLAGVRNEWSAYERALNVDLWAGAEPSPKLVALRRRLLAPSQGERAS